MLPFRAARCVAARSTHSGEGPSPLVTLAPPREDFPSKVRRSNDWFTEGLHFTPLLLKEPKPRMGAPTRSHVTGVRRSSKVPARVSRSACRSPAAPICCASIAATHDHNNIATRRSFALSSMSPSRHALSTSVADSIGSGQDVQLAQVAGSRELEPEFTGISWSTIVEWMFELE